MTTTYESNDMGPNYHIRILTYNEHNREFSPQPTIFVKSETDRGESFHEIPMTAAEELGVAPSDGFMTDYLKWNKFQGHPIFDSSKELIQFNNTGHELAKRLQEELPGAIVEPFEPLYTSLELGNPISGWWHVKDNVYGCILPVQQLPISDDLKSKLMAWRHHKSMGWLNQETVRAVKEEGHELEEHLLWEMNVRELLREEMDKESEFVRHAPSRNDSAESVGWKNCRSARHCPEACKGVTAANGHAESPVVGL